MTNRLEDSGLQTLSSNQPQQQIQLHYDAKSFIIGGKRVFLNIASIHYFRMPRQEWREVLVKAKLAGMNCVDTYFAWNVHEQEEGKWDFSGDNDCGAFLDLCSELGLWVIARPGPFICAEWDFGGFPYWLKTKENIQFRTDNEAYLRYVYLYLDQIVPVIRSRQLTKGGSVILVQVENEYGYLAEDAPGITYMNGLRDALLERGIEVPLITCEGGAEGTIEGANFWSGADGHYEKLTRKQPDVPKLVTEFWTGWFEHWGAPAATQKTPDLYEKRIMEAIRAGFDGISHYMFFGGTNFGGYGGRTVGSSDIFMVTSYDYDAPLSEYGRITDKYRTAKKMSLFTQALGEILLESEPLDNGEARCEEGIKLQGRQWNGQKLWFAESIKQEKGMFSVTLENNRTLQVSIKPGQIVPILDRIEICPGLKLTSSGFVIGNDRIGEIQTVILAGEDGGRTHIVFEADQDLHYDNVGNIPYESSKDGRTLHLDVFHFQTPQRIRLMAGGQLVEVFMLNRFMSDRAWRIQGDEIRWAIGWTDIDFEAGGNIIGVIGGSDCEPFLLGDWGREKEDVQDRADRITSNSGNAIKPLVPPSLSEWKQKTVNLLSLTSGELTERPRGFAELDLEFGYLIYSNDVECDQDQESTLIFSAIQDSARLFVNGQEQAMIRQVGAASAAVRLSKGHNKLQLLVQHMGSLNFSPFLGEEKGIFGPVYMDGSAVELRRDWYSGEEVVHLDEVHTRTFTSALTRTFELMANDQAILVGALNSGLRINGKDVLMEDYQNWFAYHAVDISAYLISGTNTIEMPVSKTPVNRLELLTYNRSRELTNWSSVLMEDAVEFEEDSGTSKMGPTWNRSTFDLPAIPEDLNPKLKLRMTGMSKGYILLNGKNLGRYWQIGPQEDYKVPMAWLKQTGNELILFDEEGRRPDSVRFLYDVQSNQSWKTLI
ncbi:beta-galactosidase [Paenibacillus gallinarum]|uniref:Beta-galactosidase n=1 Tax=Paenibacillus gallinarum TaxID=2762232 RepID=A0ABR8SVH5_9BACL|nr:beta-galactosidase [Paenibacillus gallinarum]MBD7967508.1 beta-galactosidase [Paenibacillus gallinarum]